MSGHLAMRLGADNASPYESIAVDDHVLTGLSVVEDDYKDASWSGHRLTQLRRQVQSAVDRVQSELQRAILVECRRPAVEPWMEAIVTQREAAHPLLPIARRILALIDEAERCGATLCFVAD